MAETVKSEEYFISPYDGQQDRYIIEYPLKGVNGPLVVYLHTGLSHDIQGFCEDNEWCASDLRDEVMRREGVFVSPEYRDDSWMNAAAEADLLFLIETLKKNFKPKATVLTGASMGGTSALIFASHHPEMIDGVIALCPATDMAEVWGDLSTRDDPVYTFIARGIVKAYDGTPENIPEEYAYRSSIRHVDNLTMPIAISHSDEDEILPVVHSRKLAQALLEKGSPVHYDEISGGGHSSPAIATPWRDYLDFVLQSKGQIHVLDTQQ